MADPKYAYPYPAQGHPYPAQVWRLCVAVASLMSVAVTLPSSSSADPFLWWCLPLVFSFYVNFPLLRFP
ncbi:hypothetical protein RHMOL_Rhmol10G0101900 [Rhododendron molle]|uniref:Uncharacterized protein n=1 Tax=Rhododendron molle TaxID=49168 RepID=A0ACC0M2K5_RHOML|nr:hypothetical protein RHMOL_Rhmol10G0101900 [Rhododendron molle]